MQEQEFLEFVRENIRSVWAMELLLLLKRDPSRSWQQAELVRELRANNAIVGDNLALFQRNGLSVAGEAGWRFVPANPKLDELVEWLAQSFRERPVATMSLVRLSDPIKSLSDAFRLRSEDK